MNAESFNRFVEQYSDQVRAIILRRVAFELTIQARKYYRAPFDESNASVVSGKKLVGINELQHKLLSQTGHYSDGEKEKVYPLDVFSRILFEVAERHGVTSVLVAAVKHVEARVAQGTTGSES